MKFEEWWEAKGQYIVNDMHDIPVLDVEFAEAVWNAALQAQEKPQVYHFDGQWLGSFGGQLKPLGMTDGTREEALLKLEEMKP